jgi:hypothetical protein
MTDTNQPPKDWLRFFYSEAKKAEYGTFDKFDAEPPSYLGDPEVFKARVANNHLETIVIIPGCDKMVRLLHNCTVDEDASKLNGIFGPKQLLPLKQVAIGALVKPLVAHTMTRSNMTPTIPSAVEFMECSSGADLIDLVGAGGDPIDDLENIPQSFWLHPHLLDAYVIQRQTKIEIIGNSFVLAIEGMDDDSATKLTDQYYRFLVFIRAVANGHARTLIKLADPPDDDKTDSLMEAAQTKFRKGHGQAPPDTNNAGGGPDDDNPDGDGSQERRSRSPRRHDDRHDERRPQARGNRPRSRSRSRSGERQGPGARSWSSPPPSQGTGQGMHPKIPEPKSVGQRGTRQPEQRRRHPPAVDARSDGTGPSPERQPPKGPS